MTNKPIEAAARAACKQVEDENPSHFSSSWIERAWPKYVPQLRASIGAYLSEPDEERVDRVARAIEEQQRRVWADLGFVGRIGFAVRFVFSQNTALAMFSGARAAIKAMTDASGARITEFGGG